jgi:hypothetical protein
VAAEVSAAMIEAMTAHHGTRRPPSAKSRSDSSRRPNRRPIKMMATK